MNQASTPTPDIVALVGVLTFWMMAMSPMAVSSYVGALIAPWQRAARTAADPLGLYLFVLAGLSLATLVWPGPMAIVLPGFADGVTTAAGLKLALACLAAPMLGWVTFSMDGKLTRKLARHRKPLRARPPRAQVEAASRWSKRAVSASAAVRSTDATALAAASPGHLVVIGALEEVGMRAAIIAVPSAIFAPAPLWPFALLAVLWFPAVHMRYGRVQFLAKLPLSLAATALFLAAGAVPAMIAHGVYNRLAGARMAAGAPPVSR